MMSATAPWRQQQKTRVFFSRVALADHISQRIANAHTQHTHTQGNEQEPFTRTASSPARTESSSADGFKRLFTDADVQDLIGNEAYQELKKTLAGYIADRTQMSLAHTTDGFFIGLDTECGMLAPELDTQQGFQCEALISVRHSKVLHRSFSELFVPSRIITVHTDIETVQEKLQQFTKMRPRSTPLQSSIQCNNNTTNSSTGNTQRTGSTVPGVSPLLAPADATTLQLFACDDKTGIMSEIPLCNQRSDIASNPFRREPIPLRRRTRFSKLPPTKVDIMVCSSTDKENMNSKTIIIPSEVAYEIATRYNTFLSGVHVGLQVQTQGNRMTIHCANTNTHPMNKDEAERFDVFVDLFGCIVQEHRDNMYVHGLRNFISKLSHISSTQGALTTAIVSDPPEFYSQGVANKATAAAIVRSMRLTTNRSITPTTAHVFEVLGVTLRPSPVALPASWQQHGSVSVYPLNTGFRSLLAAARQTVPFFRKMGIGMVQNVQIVRAAYAVLLARYNNKQRAASSASKNANPDGTVLLSHPNTTDTAEYIKRVETLLSDPHANYYTQHVDWDNLDVCITHVTEPKSGVDALTFQVGAAFVSTYDLGTRNLQHTSTAGGAADANDDIMSISFQEADNKVKNCATKGLLPGLHAMNMRGAAMRLAYIDALYTTHPEFARFARTLRAVWLHTEQQRLAEIVMSAQPARPVSHDDAREQIRNYYHRMHHLSELASLPIGFNYWSTVPYY